MMAISIATGMGMGMTMAATLRNQCLTSTDTRLHPFGLALPRGSGKSKRSHPSSKILDINQRSYQGYLKVTCESPVMAGPTEWVQKTFSLPPFGRGCHIITRYIYEAVPEIAQFEVGLANLFILHTSASLTLNENVSSDVLLDMEDALNRIIPEGNHYRHLDEGYDDMPAHVKASVMGFSLTMPVRAGRFHLGIWQGIWLNEHRNYGGPRNICITLHGLKGADR
ncbi:hypothetical protein KI387_023982, partial [Taxus chinensis]